MNKRSKLGLMLVILGISLCFAPQAWATIMTRLDIILAGEEVSEVAIGSSFDLNVIVSEDDPDALEDFVEIFGFITTLSPYMGSAFTINDIYMPNGLDPLYFFDLPASYPDQYISGTANADPLVSIDYGEDTLLATLNITANEIGLFDIGIISDLSTGVEGLYTIGFQEIDLTSSTNINVSTASVPEPGTVVLMLLGIGGLSFLKRRRS